MTLVSSPAPAPDIKYFDIKNTYDLRKITQSHVHINHGPKGSGKTEILAGFITLDLIIAEWVNTLYAPVIGCKLLPHPMTVWSNLPIEISYIPEQDGATWRGADKVRVLRTQDLDMHKLIMFDKDYSHGSVHIDELDQYADRQDWQNGGQKFLMRLLVQVRKLKLKMRCTIQSIQWVNPRLMFQVDTDTGCRDSAKTTWGMNNGVKDGEMVFTYTHDRSGAETGEMYEESGKTYESQFYGKPIQDAGLYDTDRIINPFERYEQLSIAKKKVQLDPLGIKRPENNDKDLQILDTEITRLHKSGVPSIERAEFMAMCAEKGMRMNKAEASHYLEDVYHVRPFISTGTPKLDLTSMTDFSKQQEAITDEDIAQMRAELADSNDE
jgi:hypothetical protein